MIIAAYAGVGKSTFAAQTERAVDLPCMPYKWILPPTEKTALEMEGEKGALYHLGDPRFPENYVLEILRAERAYDYVLIPTDMTVVRCLQEKYDREIILCYPSDDCREEYRRRFIIRGNSASFMSLFADGWDRFLDPVRENQLGVHIVMGPGEHLMDLRQRLEEERRADRTPPVPDETIDALEKKLKDRQRDLVLGLLADNGVCLYPISNLESPEEREFLYMLGRRILEDGIDIVPHVAPKDSFSAGALDVLLTKDRNAVRVFVGKHTERLRREEKWQTLF